jgi:hypothetical protein
MDNPEQFIKQIKGIRKLRVDAFKRKLRASEFQATEAYHKVGETEQALEAAKQEAFQKERDLLAGLVNGSYVKIEQVVQFSKTQQYGVQTLKNAKESIEGARKALKVAKEHVEEAKQNALRAEKKMIAIEEVERLKPWKP